jgi:hypothetical protein
MQSEMTRAVLRVAFDVLQLPRRESMGALKRPE